MEENMRFNKTKLLSYGIEYDSGQHAVNQSARIGSRQR